LCCVSILQPTSPSHCELSIINYLFLIRVGLIKMADETTVTVVDEIEQEAMEVSEETANTEAKKKEEEEDIDEEIDAETAERLSTDPRVHLIAGPLMFRDLCNLKELRTIIRQADHFEVRFFRTGKRPLSSIEDKDKDQQPPADKRDLKKPKKGYARFTFSSPSMAFWVLDSLRGMQIPRIRSVSLNAWMVNKETAHDILHQSEDKISVLKKKLVESQEIDVSHRALYFGNLSKTITEEKLKEFVPEAKEIHLPMFRGNSRGYAFIEFESTEVAEECLKSYKGKKFDTNVIVLRKIGSGKAAHLLLSAEAAGAMRGGRMRGGGRGGQRSPVRGARRYQGPIWDTWGRDDRRRPRFPAERDYFSKRERDFGRREDFRRERVDPWERDFRRDFRDRMAGYGDMRYPMRDEFMGRGYDRGYGDGWMSGGAFSRPY